MKNPHVLVLVYTGNEPTKEVIAAVSASVSTMCQVDSMDVFVMGPKEIAQSALGAFNFVIGDKKKPAANSCLTAEDNAVVLIGGMMKNILGADYTPIGFASQLVEKIVNAKKRPNNQLNKEFMNAMFILSQQDLNISKQILEENNMDEDKIIIIRDTYNLMTRHG